MKRLGKRLDIANRGVNIRARTILGTSAVQIRDENEMTDVDCVVNIVKMGRTRKRNSKENESKENFQNSRHY